MPVDGGAQMCRRSALVAIMTRIGIGIPHGVAWAGCVSVLLVSVEQRPHYERSGNAQTLCCGALVASERPAKDGTTTLSGQCTP